MPLEPWSRRRLLAAAAATPALLPAPAALAFGAGSQLDIAELMVGPTSESRPRAWERLLYEVVHTTSVEATPQAVQVGLEGPELFRHPFSVLIGTGALPALSAEAVEQLRRYLAYGGFLVLDDATGRDGGAFARSARELCARLFPTRPLAPLPGDHSVFRSFFLLDGAQGRLATGAALEGVTVGPVCPVIYCPVDLSGALDRAADGRNRFPCVPGGEDQRREALKLGINLVMYSLTSNYKHDQAHVAELMRDGKLE
jgi:hypothetical protein